MYWIYLILWSNFGQKTMDNMWVKEEDVKYSNVECCWLEKISTYVWSVTSCIQLAFPWKLCVLCLHTRLHNNHTQWCKWYTIVYEDVEYKAAIQKHHCREHSLTACLVLWKISKTIVAHNSKDTENLLSISKIMFADNPGTRKWSSIH